MTEDFWYLPFISHENLVLQIQVCIDGCMLHFVVLTVISDIFFLQVFRIITALSVVTLLQNTKRCLRF